MIAVTREPGTGKLVLITHGDLDDEAVNALLEALELADDEVEVVIDLAHAGKLRTTRELGLLSAIAFRAGPVAFRHAQRHHRRLVRVAKLSA